MRQIDINTSRQIEWSNRKKVVWLLVFPKINTSRQIERYFVKNAYSESYALKEKYKQANREGLFLVFGSPEGANREGSARLWFFEVSGLQSCQKLPNREVSQNGSKSVPRHLNT
jgi:hypothetical protein